MTCPNCGATNKTGGNFCFRCGARLAPEAPSRAEYTYSLPTVANPTQPPPPVYAAPPPAYAAPPPTWLPPQPPLQPVASGGRRGPAIVAVLGALALLIIAAVVLYFVTNTLHPSQNASVQQQAEIVAAIEANNNAQIAALRNLDPTALEGKMSGPALTENQSEIQNLRSKGIYEDAHLIKIDYQRAAMTDADHATIQTVEQWDSTLHALDGTGASSPTPTQTLHETYRLIRNNGHWVVNQVDIKEDPPPTLGPGDQN
ncbi:MAG: zinc ribbon domain-containing protein [Chloroflexia bacterium]